VVEAAGAAGAPLQRVRRVVLGTPGLVDPSTGEISFAFDLPRWHRGLLGALRADLDRPVVFENDVNLAAIAEQHHGAAVGVADFVLVWVGRGVGLAVVLGGKLFHGATGAAGEIGYLPVPGSPVPRDVSRRAKGSFQTLIGADAVRAVAREHGFKAASGAEAVRAAIAAGTKGGPVLDEVARRLALGVAAVGVVLDPALVVLAGDIGQAGGMALAQRVQHEVAAIAPVSPRVVGSEVPSEPVLNGALLTGLDAVREEVFGSTVG
jgi:predicted NBD/HSP70 family sugar kinase